MQVMSFNGLATLYQRFIQNFSTIAAPLMDCLKNKTFELNLKAKGSFQDLKVLSEAPILAMPYCDKMFELSSGDWWSP